MKTGRNDSCPCGSGKKYKHCCLNKDIKRAVAPVQDFFSVAEPPDELPTSQEHALVPFTGDILAEQSGRHAVPTGYLVYDDIHHVYHNSSISESTLIKAGICPECLREGKLSRINFNGHKKFRGTVSPE